MKIFVCCLVRKTIKNDKIYYYLNKSLNDVQKEEIRTLSATYKPLRLYVYSSENIKLVRQWVDYAILGRVGDNSLVFRFDKKSDTELCFDYSKSGNLILEFLMQALLKAFVRIRKIYI